MNKKEFLEKLEKKLSVLNENERKDIISEYTDTINEKTKRGQSEEEAVKDFGNLDDLAKEILSAYKIDPDYEEKEETFTTKSEAVIKRWATKIAEWTDGMVNSFKASNKEINLELVFEILIKIFITLIVLLVFRGIFEGFKGLGHALFSGLFSPVGDIIYVLWVLLLVVIYILLAILLIISMFKKYFVISKSSNENKKEVKKETKISKKSETKESKDKETKDDKIPEDVKTVKTNEEKPHKKGTSIGDACLLIVKILVIIYIFIPFVFIALGLLTGTAVSAYYWIKGINLAGLTIALAGMSIIFIHLSKLIFNLVFGKKRPSVVPIIVSLIMIIVGGFMFVDMIMNVKYLDEAPAGVKEANVTESYKTDKQVILDYERHYDENSITRTIAAMPDGEFKVEVLYDGRYNQVELKQTDNFQFSQHCHYDYDSESGYDYEDEYEAYQRCNDSSFYNLIEIDLEHYDDFNEFKDQYHQVINDLKDNKLYNYSKQYDTRLVITANQKTMDMIKIR